MSERTWTAVDDYIVDRLVAADPALDGALERNAAAGLPAIDVSPPQGKLLYLLAKIAGARDILEIGTLGGYSTIWMAKALPADGKLITLEFQPHHAETARQNIEAAGFGSQVEIRVGAAARTLPALAAEGVTPFDFVFIDADKPNNATYLDWAIKLCRPGAVIVLDNVVRGGAVADAGSSDANVLGSREGFDFFHDHPQLEATAIQTVGGKGYDGFAIARVKRSGD